MSLNCPICDLGLVATSRKYNVRELFELWKPAKFPDEVIESHLRISLDTQLFKCNHCELEIFFPDLPGSPEFYEVLINQYQYYETFKWDFHEALKDLNQTTSIMELGCGTGVFLEQAKKITPSVFGSEYNNIALTIARNKSLTVFGSDESELISNQLYDVVFSFHVLEHVTNPVGFIANMKQMIKKDGIIAISVPNQDGPIKYIEPCIMNMPPHHLTRWHLKTFRVLAEKLDLKIERIAYEPLLLANHSYYSKHLLDYKFKSNFILIKLLKMLISVLLSIFFKILKLLGFRYFNWLKGMAIYITFKNK